MLNPFKIPLRSTPGAVNTVELGQDSNNPEYIDPVVNSPLPYHGTVGERFQETNPGYAGNYDPHFMDSKGMPEPLSILAPAPGSENLSAPRNAGEIGGSNRLFKPHGPVSAVNQSGWTGKNTALRKPVVGNSGPVGGGRDNSQIASQAYFASVAARVAQQASDAAMVSW